MTTIKPALELAARAAIAGRAEALFRAAGAVREGHVLLERGRHGEVLVETSALLTDPAATSELCGFWATAARDLGIGLVAGAGTGGAILAFETARQLGARAMVADQVSDGEGATHPGSSGGRTIQPGERVLLVDDGRMTGRSMLQVIPLVEALGGEIVGCEVLVDQGEGRAALTSSRTGRTYPLRSLWRLGAPTYEPGPATCPRCAAGDPLDVPDRMGTAAATALGV